MKNKIARARATMRRAFEKDAEFKHSYIANIAMILLDDAGIPHPNRDEIAEKIIDRIFSA